MPNAVERRVTFREFRRGVYDTRDSVENTAYGLYGLFHKLPGHEENGRYNVDIKPDTTLARNGHLLTVDCLTAGEWPTRWVSVTFHTDDPDTIGTTASVNVLASASVRRNRRETSFKVLRFFLSHGEEQKAKLIKKAAADTASGIEIADFITEAAHRVAQTHFVNDEFELVEESVDVAQTLEVNTRKLEETREKLIQIFGDVPLERDVRELSLMPYFEPILEIEN